MSAVRLFSKRSRISPPGAGAVYELTDPPQGEGKDKWQAALVGNFLPRTRGKAGMVRGFGLSI